MHHRALAQGSKFDTKFQQKTNILAFSKTRIFICHSVHIMPVHAGLCSPRLSENHRKSDTNKSKFLKNVNLQRSFSLKASFKARHR